MGQGRVWKVVIGMKKGDRKRERGLDRLERRELTWRKEREREREAHRRWTLRTFRAAI